MTASSGASVRGTEGAMPGRGVGVAIGPSSAAAGVAKPMAQSATATEAWRTKAFFVIYVVGTVSQVVAVAVRPMPSRSRALVPSAADAGVVRSVNRRLGTGLTAGQGADRPLSDRALEMSLPDVSLHFVLRYRCCARNEQAGENAATEAQSISRYGKNGDGGGVHGI